MEYYKEFSSRALILIDAVKKAENGNHEELEKLSRQAYWDYQNDIISENEYERIHALLMELAYPR